MRYADPLCQDRVDELEAEVDRLTGPPTHDERQDGLSDSHSESYRLGWRMGRALATDALAEVQRLGTEADALAQRAREAEAEVDRLRAQLVTTADELEALPPKSLLLVPLFGGAAWVFIWTGSELVTYDTGVTGDIEWLVERYGPLTVVWQP